MVRCCSFVNYVDTTHTVIIHFNNNWTSVFVADTFIRRWTVDVDSMPEMLLASIVTDRRSNHLQQATLSVNWYLWPLLFICLSGFISAIPFLSILVVPVP